MSTNPPPDEGDELVIDTSGVPDMDIPLDAVPNAAANTDELVIDTSGVPYMDIPLDAVPNTAANTVADSAQATEVINVDFPHASTTPPTRPVRQRGSGRLKKKKKSQFEPIHLCHLLELLH